MKHFCQCVALVLVATSCARDASENAGSTSAASEMDRATSAAAVSNAIAANPAAADSILRAHGYTTADFERLMYDIASDSAMSARYAAAKR